MQEESSEYIKSPDWLDPLKGTAPNTQLEQVGQMTRVITSKKQAATFIQQAGDLVMEVGNGPYILEISTAKHSMMARYKPNGIEAIESEKSGVQLVKSWQQLAEFLWVGIIHGYENDEPMQIPLDIDVKRAVPLTEETNEVGEYESGILGPLQIDSLETFKGLEKGSGPGKFLSDYNSRLYNLIWPEND